MTEWSMYAEKTVWQEGVSLHIGRKRRDGGTDVATSITFLTVLEDDIGPGPALRGTDAEAFLRAALNCAWEFGLRPDGYHDTRESMKATDAHLQDMRAIAFHKLGAGKP